MLSRKWMTMGISMVFAAMLFTVPASAHGHHSRGHHSRTESGCASTFNTETNTAYTDKTAEIGCPMHVYGAVNGNCPVCIEDGCTQTGHHLHEDTIYCGYAHENGYCDGTCAAIDESGASTARSSASMRVNTPTYRGHHGGC